MRLTENALSQLRTLSQQCQLLIHDISGYPKSGKGCQKHNPKIRQTTHIHPCSTEHYTQSHTCTYT